MKTGKEYLNEAKKKSPAYGEKTIKIEVMTDDLKILDKAKVPYETVDIGSRDSLVEVDYRDEGKAIDALEKAGAYYNIKD